MHLDHDVTFTVSIRGVTVDGQPHDLDFTIVAFDPGATTIVPKLDGPATGGVPTNLPAPTFPLPGFPGT